MLIPTVSKLHNQSRADTRRPDHKHRRYHHDRRSTLRHEQRDRRHHHQRQHTIPNQAQTLEHIQIPVFSGQHVEDDVEEHRGHGDPPENDPEMQFSGKELEEAEGHDEEERAGEIGVFVEMVVDSERVENGDGFLVYLLGIYAQLLQERGLVVQASKAGGGGEGGGGGGGIDIEGEEGDAGVGGSRRLEWRGGEVALLRGGGAPAGAEYYRRNVRHLI